jgi:hypothetical protein
MLPAPQRQGGIGKKNTAEPAPPNTVVFCNTFEGKTGPDMLGSSCSHLDPEPTSVLQGTNWPVANTGPR